MTQRIPVRSSDSTQDIVVPWWRTDLGESEIESVAQSIRGRHINQGPVCRQLEERLAGVLEVPHVVMTTSGSAALLLANLACGVTPGDEIIMPALSFVATAHACLLPGARVILVDVCRDRPLIDAAQIESQITDKTKAIVVVHLNGEACDLQGVKEVAARRQLHVIEDAAQALGSRDDNGFLGTQADIGTFSMSIAKLITTGEGGFVATRDAKIADRLRKLRNHGVESVPDNVFDGFGFNLRFNDLLAGVGLAQFERLPEKIAAVKRIYSFYRDRLAGLHFLKMLPVYIERGEVPLWSQALCAERDRVIELLLKRNVQARPFNPCLSRSPYIGNPQSFPQAERFASLGLTLPSGPDQTPENLERTVAALHEIAGEVTTTIDPLPPSPVESEP